jgi:hypothetical protein
MKRIAIVVLVLAALAAISAHGLPVRPAKTHKSAPAAVSPISQKSPQKAQQPVAHAARHAAEQATRRATKPATGPKAARASVRKSPPAVNPCAAPVKSPAPAPPAIEAKTPSTPAAAKPVSLRRKGPVALSRPLFGSHESLVRQNQKTEDDGLERIQDDDDLADRIARKMLVRVPVSSALAVNASLPENRRYCRPWTASFLADLARVHAALFHRPVLVSSAVRTVEYQKRLMEINGNAAAAEGDIASPHLTGATIDIAKQGLSRQELVWLRAWLLPLENAGKIDVEEEFQQTCFHITVYKSYVPQTRPRNPKPQKPSSPAQLASRGM